MKKKKSPILYIVQTRVRQNEELVKDVSFASILSDPYNNVNWRANGVYFFSVFLGKYSPASTTLIHQQKEQ